MDAAERRPSTPDGRRGAGRISAAIDPRRHHAVIFDLDGVITDTASVHAAAWKRLFDEYLAGRHPRGCADHSPFTDDDYRRYVDGKPRYDGVASFLEARGIRLPWGNPSDAEEAETVCGLGNRKNRYFRERLDGGGVTVFDSTVALVHRLREAGLGTAVFSSSRNCRPVLEAAGLGDLFPVRVDGVVADELSMPGKPDPAVLLEATRRLGVEPARCVVVEDAESGVAAGRRGGFALVVGVDRDAHAERLRAHGADVVVADLSEVAVRPADRMLSTVPDALASWDELAGLLRRRPTVFLDFDGTLSNIVSDPRAAVLVDGARTVLQRLAGRCPVAIISGRDLRDVRHRVGLDGIWYAGSHGFEVAGPGGEHHELAAAHGALAALDAAEATLRDRLADVPGALVDRKRYALAVHYRLVDDDAVDRVVAAVRRVGGGDDRLRVTGGRKVVELLPAIDWDKGRALQWLLERIVEAKDTVPVFAGDDLTDEDALRAVRTVGVGIHVRHGNGEDRPSAAHFAVDGPDQLCVLLDRLADLCESAPEGRP